MVPVGWVPAKAMHISWATLPPAFLMMSIVPHVRGLFVQEFAGGDHQGHVRVDLFAVQLPGDVPEAPAWSDGDIP